MDDGHIPFEIEDDADFNDADIDLGWDSLPDDDEIQCVFSTEKKVKMGMGASATTRINRVYWFVEQASPNEFRARKINQKNVPSGDYEKLTKDQLVESFTPQLLYYEDVVLPAMENLEDILDEGDEHREGGRLYSAEGEYGRALAIEERNVRALFGLGLVFSIRKEAQRTRELLAELVQVKAAFNGKNQHLFNEFAISLRKAKLFPEAVVFYRRGLDFTKDDENLYYNLARAHYENDDWAACLDGLVMSNRINPGLDVARDLFQLIVGLADDERLLQRYGKPPVPREVAVRARQILAVETNKVVMDEEPVFFGAHGRARSGNDLTNIDDDQVDMTLDRE